jgi:hypothetical protein
MMTMMWRAAPRKHSVLPLLLHHRCPRSLVAAATVGGCSSWAVAANFVFIIYYFDFEYVDYF